MENQPEFIRRQYAFAAHIRDPQQHPAPADVEERRMAIYRELFYNNVEGFLSGTFPVLRSLLDDTTWHAMARDFFAQHHSRTPLFLEIPREFLNWLRKERTAQPGDLPFLSELAHYEWLELALSVAEESIPTAGIDVDGDLLEGVPVLSPLAWHLGYTWPVHKIGPDSVPDAPGPQPTCLVIYRNPADEVGFLEINPVTKRLLELVEEGRHRVGRSLLEQIAAELSHPDPAVVISAGNEILCGLRAKSVIIGTRA
jgi:hypothetical protein